MKIKISKYDIFVNLTCLALLIGIVVYLVLFWNRIPDKIPGHYNAAGVVDRWGNKGELFVVPIVAWIMYIGLTILERFPQVWNTGVQVTEENKERVYRILKNMISTEKLLMVAVFIFLTINSSFSIGLPIWFLPVFLILMFGSLILFIISLIKTSKH